MQHKNCIVCSKTFERPKGISHKLWENRKSCSQTCRLLWMKNSKIGFQPGHKRYAGVLFQKGQTAWNKNLKGRQPWMNTSGLITDGSINRGKKMSEEQKQKLSLAAKGRKVLSTTRELHWNWKGGISQVYRQIRNMSEFKQWRNKVYAHHHKSCAICFSKNVRLHVDHIKPLSHIVKQYEIWSPQAARKCSELWNVSNGRPLCVSCHRRTRTYGGRASIN